MRSSGARARAARVAVTALASCAALGFAGCSDDADGGSSTGAAASVATPASSAGGNATVRTSPTGQASASAAPSRSMPATASPSGSNALAAPALPTVRGYTYGRPPAAVAAAFVAARVTPAGVLSAPYVRSVRKGDDVIGSVAVRALARDHVGDTALEISLVDAMVAGLGPKGYTVRSRIVSGDRVVIATAKGSTILAWYSRGLVLQLVSSAPLEDPLAYAEAYLAAH